MKKTFFITTFLFFGFADILHAQNTIPVSQVKIPILVYHSVRPYYPGITNLVKQFTVPPDIFDEQLKYMRDNGFNPIKPSDLTDYFVSGKTLPKKPFMVTFDDGWENQFRYALPILKKYKDTAVFYLYSNAIDTKHFVTLKEVKELVNANMVIGGHTKSHPELPKVANDELLKKEIIDSKKFLELKTGKIIDDFAYPFGEYNDKVINVVNQGGYKTARGVVSCLQEYKDKPFTLCGIIVTGDFNRFVSLVNR